MSEREFSSIVMKSVEKSVKDGAEQLSRENVVVEERCKIITGWIPWTPESHSDKFLFL